MILGEHIRLRPVERADLSRFVAWFADPEVRRHLATYQPLGLAQEEQWFQRNLEAGDTQAWAIEAPAGGGGRKRWIHIGACGYHRIDWRNRVAEMGILIGDKKVWDRGYGTDATRTLLSWGFDTLNLHRVWLRVYSDNPRAVRCYEKVGFRLEGRLRRDNFHEGAFRDTLLMGVLREEWNPTGGVVKRRRGKKPD